jgi:uncharacterized protein YbjQ (UPF0145 family)
VIAPADVVTVTELSGWVVAERLGEVRAESVCPRDRVRATLRTLGMFIGIVRVEQSPETQRARQAAADALAEAAGRLGANAVIGVRFEASLSGESSVIVRAVGDAVVLEPEPVA